TTCSRCRWGRCSGTRGSGTCSPLRTASPGGGRSRSDAATTPRPRCSAESRPAHGSFCTPVNGSTTASRSFRATVRVIMKLLWSAGLRVVDAGKRHLKHGQWFRSLPGLRYTYLFDLPKAIVVPELRLVFVPTPKAANRSIKAAIRRRLDPGFRGDPHQGWRYTPVALMRDNDFFRFGFVRNPLDRLLSCYTQKIVHYGRERAMPLEFWRYGKTFHPDMSFADFVHAVAAIPDRLADIHFRSQYTFFYHRGRLMADFVGRYERLDEHWEHLR